LLFGTYWQLGTTTAMSGFVQDRMGHACEWETSMMLRLAPSLVGEYLKTEFVPFGTPFEPAARGWTTPDRSGPGHIGDPRAASAQKGEVLFTRFVEDAVGLLKRVIAWDGTSWSG
jgi:creatinine amidohydrolase